MNETSSHRRPGILWPLLLIAAGVIFLLDNLNIIPGTFWDILVRYWPMLFVLISIENLIRGEGFFGPIFTIGSAIIFQLSILGIINWSIWEIILRFWPVLIIVIGLDVLLGRRERRSIPGMLLGLVLIVAIVGGILWYTSTGPGRIQGSADQTEVIDVSLENSKQANVKITAPFADLSVTSGTSPDKLAEGSIGLSRNNSIKQNYEVTGSTGNLSLESSSITTFAPGLSRAGAEWTVRLNETVPLDIQVASIFSKSTLDMSRLTLDGLKFDNIFSTATFTLPGKDSVDGSIDSVFATLNLLVPVDAAVSITMDGFLSPTTLPSGYTKNGNIILSPAAVSRGADVNITCNLVFSTIKIETVPSN